MTKEPNDTVEICSQGGIDAAKGFSDFKVYPVQVIARVPKTRRENGGSGQRNPAPHKAAAFAEVLEKTVREEQPMDCCVVTYNASRKLQTFSYGYSREYTI